MLLVIIIISHSIFIQLQNDYFNITLDNYTDILEDNNFITLSDCRNSENIIDIIIPALIVTKPYGLSLLCLIFLYGIHFNQTFIP